jgi:hypothetical protein
MWALDAAGQAEGRFVSGLRCWVRTRLAAAASQEKRHAKYRATDHCPRQLRARHPIGCREGTRKRAILCACCIVGTDDAARPCRRRRVTRRKCLGERFVDEPFVVIRRARVGRRRIRLGRVSARISLENHVNLRCVFRCDDEDSDGYANAHAPACRRSRNHAHHLSMSSARSSFAARATNHGYEQQDGSECREGARPRGNAR